MARDSVPGPIRPDNSSLGAAAEPMPEPRSFRTRWSPVIACLALAVAWILAADHVFAWMFRGDPRLLRIAGKLNEFVLVAFTASLAVLWWRAERRRAAAALGNAVAQASLANERMAWMTRHAKDVFLLIDADGRIVDCNETAERVYGYSRDELLAMEVFALRERRAADADIAREQFDKVREDGHLVFETHHVRKDGTAFPVEVSSYRVDFRGQPLVQSIVRDISRRKALERGNAQIAAERDRLLERLHLQFESMPVGCAVTDESMRLIEINPAFVRIFGYEWSDYAGKDLYALIVPPDLLNGMRDFLAAVSRSGETCVSVNDNLTSDGRRVTCRWTNVPLRGPDGRSHGMLSMCEDITESMRDQQELVASRRRIERQRDLYALLSRCNHEVARLGDKQALFESVVRFAVEHGRFLFAWVAELRADGSVHKAARYGDDGGFVEKVNVSAREGDPAAQGPVGLTLRYGVTVVVNRFLVDEVTRAWRELALETGVLSVAAVPIRTRGVVNAALMLYSGEENFFDAQITRTLEEMASEISFGLDSISTRRELTEAQRELRAANARLESTVAERTAELVAARDKAEAADRTKLAFLSTVSHELRTPLNSIMGFTEIVLQGLSGPLTPDQERQLRIVQDSSRMLLDLINEILDISSIEAGRLKLSTGIFDVAELLRSRVQSFETIAATKGLRLACEIDPRLGPMTSDAKRVAQIVSNLLANAVKFTQAGEVALYARVVDQGLEVEVRDTGPGISPEDAGRLFTPFAQAGQSGRGRHEGTGLGLAISRHLAHALGGEITLASEVGKGTSFTLALPLGVASQDDREDTGLFRRILPAKGT